MSVLYVLGTGCCIVGIIASIAALAGLVKTVIETEQVIRAEEVDYDTDEDGGFFDERRIP